MVPVIRRGVRRVPLRILAALVPMIRRSLADFSLPIPIVAGLLLVVAACGPADDAGTEDAATEDAATPDVADSEAAMTAAAMEQDNDIIGLLDAGQPVFGMFAPERSAEGGAQAAANAETDFIFYSLESGPWDIPTLEAFMATMAESSAGQPHPVVLRIPPIRDDREAARTRLAEGLAADVDGLVLPHVESVEDVALATEAVGDRLWPLSADGDVLNVILIEDQVGIERAREIVGAPGVGVAIPGPGDLRRAYEDDMEAVENAIQTVLAACLELDVPCGITAGPDDIAERLDQGFEMIIVTSPEALSVGREVAGR